jgi:hypothetical protein
MTGHTEKDEAVEGAEPQEAPISTGTDGPVQRRHLMWASALSLVLLVIVASLGGQIDTLARNFLGRLTEVTAPAETREVKAAVVEEVEVNSFAFKGLDLHPDLLFQPYLSGTVVGSSTALSAKLVKDFRDFFTMFEQRQRYDDRGNPGGRRAGKRKGQVRTVTASRLGSGRPVAASRNEPPDG